MFHVFGVICYVLSVILGIGLVFNLVISIIRWDLSPWWFWPAGAAVVIALQTAAGNLMGRGQPKGI